MQLAFQLIPTVFSAVEVRAVSWPLNFFQTNLGKPCFFGPRILHRGIVVLLCNLRFQFGERPHIDAIAMSLHTFGHIIYTYTHTLRN